MPIETSELIIDPGSVIGTWSDLDSALSYWRGKFHGDDIPCRDDIDLLDVPEILPQINLVDVVQQPDGSMRYRHRMEGVLLVDRFKRSSTGAWFDENYDPAHLAKQLLAYDDAAKSGNPNLARIRVVEDGLLEIDYTRLIMPLAENGGDVNMLIVVFSFNKYDSKSIDVLPIHQP